MPDNLTLAGIACLIYALAFFWFGVGTARVSQQVEEGFFRWPPAGRVLVALACFGFAAIFATAARIILHPQWMERMWPSDPTHWDFVAVMLFPLPWCVWVALRLAGNGLTGNSDARLVAHRDIPPSIRLTERTSLSDNVRRSIRCMAQALVGGLFHELLETNGVYDVAGWWEAFAVAGYACVSNFTWNTLEDRWGVRFLPPLDHRLGDAELARRGGDGS